MNQDVEHLRLLAIFHYVVGGIAALFACIPLIHLTLGLVMLFAPDSFQHKQGEEVELHVIGLIFAIVGGTMVLAGWTFAVCVLLAARFLKARTHYTFCLVMAGIMCIFVPFGTVLGVLTLIVLTRNSVKQLFETPVVAAVERTP